MGLSHGLQLTHQLFATRIELVCMTLRCLEAGFSVVIADPNVPSRPRG